MAKRFIDTTIWTQNKWFRNLSAKHKVFWFYLISNCDAVGVWEEDFELASYIIKEEITKEEIDTVYTGKIKWINDKKLWIIGFCNFQYGILKEENITNKPHQSYINLLKKHSLWIDYTKTMQSLKEEEEEKEMVKEEKVKVNISEQGKLFSEWFKKLLPLDVKIPDNYKLSWGKIYDDLLRIDKREKEETKKICQWARSDEFWAKNFLSPAKLRSKNKDGVCYYDVFKAAMIHSQQPQKKNGYQREEPVGPVIDVIYRG